MSGFSQELKVKIKGYLTRYETRQSSIIPILHCIQDEHDWVHPEHIDILESEYGFNRVQVKEVISFYDIFSDQPAKKYRVRFCNNVTCYMLGSKKIISHLKGKVKEAGDNCDFSVEPFPCLGKCDGAPVMLVNKDRYENLSVENVGDVLNKIAPFPS